MTAHLVQFSTGAGSAEVAWRVVHEYGAENVVLLSADTLVEDADNWRFAQEVVDQLGCEWVRIADGRTPMEVGRDVRVVPNNRLAVCSRILKRELLRDYIEEFYEPESTIIYLGFDWTEPERHERSIEPWKPWRIESPLISPPYVSKPDLLNLWRERGIEPPRLYAQGFHHANCGGACVRGGQAQWELLLRVNRPRYLEWEVEEQISRDMLGTDVSILRDRTKGQTRPLTLQSFRERLDSQPSMFESDDWGACGCTEEPRPTPTDCSMCGMPETGVLCLDCLGRRMGGGRMTRHNAVIRRAGVQHEVKCSCGWVERATYKTTITARLAEHRAKEREWEEKVSEA